MRKAPKRLPGIVMIVVFGALLVLAVARPSNPFADRYRYYAVFDSVQGLGPIDRDVRVAGVKVGKIGEVQRVGDDARVELVLDEDITLHRDAEAAMRPHTLFEGSNFVDLSPGSPSAPVLSHDGTIPRRHTRSYVTLDKALRILRPDIRREIRQLAAAGSATLRDEGVDGVQRTLSRAPQLVREIAPAARAIQGSNRRELAGAISGMSRTVGALQAHEDQLASAVQRANRTVRALATDRGAPLDATLAALPGALTELRGAAPKLTAIIGKVDRMAHNITPALPDAAAALRAATPVLERTVPVLSDGRPVVRDARLIGVRLARANSGLVEMFGLIAKSQGKLGDLLDTFNAPSSLGADTVVRQLVGGAFGGLDAAFRGFQTVAQAPGAPGHRGRVGIQVDPQALVGLRDLLGGGGQAGSRSGAMQIPCAEVARLSPAAARRLRAMEGCR